MLKNLVDGLTTLGSTQALIYLFGGSLIGVVFGVIPGLGGAVILSIILAFIYHISLTGTICLFLAVQAASYYSASVTSILLNTPAHPEAFAVTFDGFPMSQRGEAGRALGISATATCIGGIIGCAVLVGFIQIVNELPLIFHPPEFVALVLIALLLVGTLGTDKVSKAIVSAGIGIMLSAIGTDPVTAVQRFTFGSVDLISGISLVSLALGLFAVPQMVLIFGTATTIARQDMMGNEVAAQDAVGLQKGFGKQIFQGIGDALGHWVALIRGGLIGVCCGIIPGIGGFAANFLSYGVAQQTSKQRELFGTGIPEGIIAPEASSLSKEAGSMIPIIGLGIPGGVGGALFLAALVIKGVHVGYGFDTEYPSLPYEMMWVIMLGGIIGTLVGLCASPLLARVTKVPGPLLVPFIMVLSALGPFVADIAFFSVVEGLVFTITGFLLRRLRYSLAAFAIGLVLGPTLENNIFLTHEVFPGWSFVSARPLADVLFAIAIGVMILKTVQLHGDAKKANPPITEEDPDKRAELEAERFRKQNPFPQLAFLTTLTLFALSLAITIYAIEEYRWNSALFPVLGAGMATLGSLWRLPTDAISYVRYLKLRKILRANVVYVEPVYEVHAVTGKRLPPKIADKSWGYNGQYTRELFALALYCALIGGMYVFGFYLAVPVFTILYGLFATKRIFPGIIKRLIYSGIGAGVLWLAAYEMLNLLHLTFTAMINL
jgi:putative tricarboxylic transport membrane protein